MEDESKLMPPPTVNFLPKQTPTIYPKILASLPLINELRVLKQKEKLPFLSIDACRVSMSWHLAVKPARQNIDMQINFFKGIQKYIFPLNFFLIGRNCVSFTVRRGRL